MSEKILVPVLGESITEATVTKWLKKKGDNVVADEAVVELETDKVNLEVPAPASGVISEINSKDGDTVEVGTVLGMISEGSALKEEKEAEPVKGNVEKNNVINLEIEKKKDTKKTQEPLLLDEEPLVLTDEVEETKPIKQNKTLSPAVRKMVVENKINLDEVKGTGKDGRILKGDLISLMGANPQPNERKIQYGEEERIKMSRLRQTIAKRLKEAQNNAAMLTTFNEVDMGELIRTRNEHKDAFESKYGIKLGFMSFFVKACITALKDIPEVNAEVENNDVIYKNFYNIGVAVGTDQGLVVPVIRDADQKSIVEIEQEIFNLGQKARTGKLSIDDMQGGTFTVSNGGVYGSLMSTPILNPPQSGILGMHKIEERPVAVNGDIVIRPMMYLALSYDHRIVDGKGAVTFLVRVKESLEDPNRILLGV